MSKTFDYSLFADGEAAADEDLLAPRCSGHRTCRLLEFSLTLCRDTRDLLILSGRATYRMNY